MGLLVGTVLYIIGGYFLPFLVYSIIMLLLVPFGAKLIPSKPLEEKGNSKHSDKSSDEDLEIGEGSEHIYDKGVTVAEIKTENVHATIKRKINPFKLVWTLLSNKVNIL